MKIPTIVEIAGTLLAIPIALIIIALMIVVAPIFYLGVATKDVFDNIKFKHTLKVTERKRVKAERAMIKRIQEEQRRRQT